MSYHEPKKSIVTSKGIQQKSPHREAMISSRPLYPIIQIIMINNIPYKSIKKNEIILRRYIFTDKKTIEEEMNIINSYITKKHIRYFFNPLTIEEKWYDGLEFYEESIPIENIFVANSLLATIIEGKNPEGRMIKRLKQIAKEYIDTLVSIKDFKGEFKYPEYLVFKK